MSLWDLYLNVFIGLFKGLDPLSAGFILSIVAVMVVTIGSVIHFGVEIAKDVRTHKESK